MQISVIIPVFNSARFLPDALASVRAQIYPPFEVIIVDGPSTDETGQIARAFANVRYHRQTGTGMWNALNEGISLARGNAIAFLSSDDLWDTDKLRLQNQWLEEHPETAAVFTNAQYVTMDEGSHLFDSKPELFERPFPAYLTENILARRELFDRLGTFPTEYRVSGDMDWFGRLIDSGESIHMLSQVLLTKRFHRTNLSTAPSWGAEHHRELLQIMRKKILRGREAPRGT